MNHEKFEEVAMRILDRIETTMTLKGKEYANKETTGDRLIAFKEGARRQGITSIECLRGYWDKHIGSIYDMIYRYSRGEYFELEKWQEKFTDSIVYLILAEALLIEKVIPTQNATSHEASGQ